MRKIIILAVLMVLCAHSSVLAKKEWDEQKGTNFTVFYHKQAVPQDFVDTVMESAEEEIKNVTSNMGITRYQGWQWDKRASIYIYSTQDDYVQNGGQAGWSEGSAVVSTKTIKTYPLDNGFFDSILPHEMGHIILHEMVGPYADIPLWFDEGVAMYQEKSRRLGAGDQVKKAIKNGQFIPLTQLMDMRLYNETPEATVQLFYAESASVVNFLITEFGALRFHKLCLELKENTRFPDALAKIYMRIKSIEDLNKMWVKHLEEQ